MASEILVNTGSGNGLMPDSSKPLPESVLTYHQQDPLAFNRGNIYLNKIHTIAIPELCLKFAHLKSHPHLPGNMKFAHLKSQPHLPGKNGLIETFMAAVRPRILLCMRQANETALHCNVVSHWLGTYTKWSLAVCCCNTSLKLVPRANLSGNIYRSSNSTMTCKRMQLLLVAFPAEHFEWNEWNSIWCKKQLSKLNIINKSATVSVS